MVSNGDSTEKVPYPFPYARAPLREVYALRGALPRHRFDHACRCDGSAVRSSYDTPWHFTDMRREQSSAESRPGDADARSGPIHCQM